MSINISIPIKLKKSHQINFGRNRKRDVNGSIASENYAGGINFYLNQRYKNSTLSNELESQPLTASSDIFLNIHDFILEGRIDYQEERENEFIRDRFRLIKDDEENYLRYSVGDILLPHHNKMSYQDSFGISVQKVLDISDSYHQNVSRVSSYEFFLKNSSVVEIFINDRYNRSLTLDAGTHNLYDFNLPSGLNSVKLKIIEENGKVEYLEFDEFSYAEVLEKGFMLYGISAGVLSQQDKNSNKWIYDKEKKLVSAYLDYGLTNWLTVKSGFQTIEDYNSVALEFLIGSNFGFFNPYMIYSNVNNIDGYKRGLLYRTNLSKININLGYENADETYTTIGSYQVANSSSTKSTLYKANIYSSLDWGINMGVSASRYDKNNEIEDKYGLTLAKTFFNTFDTRLNYNRVNRVNTQIEDNIYITFSYRIGHSSLNYTNYINDDKQQIGLGYKSNGKYGILANAMYEDAKDYNKYNLRSTLNDEKFKLDATYTSLENENIANKNQSLAVQLSTGIVFAGDTATITAPITSSFIIVSNDDKAEKALGVEGYQESEDFIYDTFALSSSDYYEHTLTVDESELDFGIDIKNPEQKFITKYKSGSVMNIDIKNLLSVKGVILDENGNPLKYKAFNVFNTQIGSKEMGFTNKDGEFTIGEIEIGKYNARLIKEQGYEGIAKFNFEIKESDIQKKLIDLGTIKIKMPKKKDTKKYIIFDGKNKK